MNEINDEIKLTINLMQSVDDEFVYVAMKKHLDGLLEIKRNELQQRLVERSWSEPADGMGSVVKFDQAPYKSVKLEGQIDDGAKPLTADELKAGGWWCADVSEECRLAFAASGTGVTSNSWNDYARVQCAYKPDSETNVLRAQIPIDLHNFKQIHRIGNDFYWGE